MPDLRNNYNAGKSGAQTRYGTVWYCVESFFVRMRFFSWFANRPRGGALSLIIDRPYLVSFQKIIQRCPSDADRTTHPNRLQFSLRDQIADVRLRTIQKRRHSRYREMHVPLKVPGHLIYPLNQSFRGLKNPPPPFLFAGADSGRGPGIRSCRNRFTPPMGHSGSASAMHPTSQSR